MYYEKYQKYIENCELFILKSSKSKLCDKFIVNGNIVTDKVNTALFSMNILFFCS